MEPTQLPSGPGEPGRICLVTAELAYLHRNGGIGTANWHLALALAQAGFEVHILYTGQLPDADTLQQARHRLEQAGVGLTPLHHRRRPRWLEKFPHANWHVGQSEWVAHVLTQLHQEQRFDLIEFAELGALGFRSLQARRAGMALGGASVLVKLHSSNQWCREANQRWMHTSVEMLLDYSERYSFEQADVQLAPCRYMLDYAQGIGWPVREQAQVVPYIYPQPIGFAPPPSADARTEVVFFGRLESRKGLELFVRAARRLDPLTPITFLGSVLPLTGGAHALHYIHQQLGKRPIRLLGELNQEQAIRYLLSRPCLAVIPSLIDNFPNTLIECITHRIPFVATSVGGIPEMVADPELKRRLLCEPTTDDLLRAIRDYLDASLEDRLEIHDRLAQMVDLDRHNRKVVESYREILQRCREGSREAGLRTREGETPAEPDFSLTDGSAGASPSPHSLITVAVAGTSAEGLAETLDSLRRQTYERLEILLLDGPTLAQISPTQRREWQQQDNRLRLVDHDQVSLAGQWQEALQEAQGEFFLPLVAGTIAGARLVEMLVRGLNGNDLLAGLTCPVLGYLDATKRAREEWEVVDRPTGGSRLLACLENVFGDGPTLYRTELLRHAGGYDLEAPSGPQGWVLGVKLLDQGFPIDVAPELLAQVRVSRDSSRQMMDLYQMHCYLLERYISHWSLSPQETAIVWSALSGSHRTILYLNRQGSRLAGLGEMYRKTMSRIRKLIPEPGRRWIRRTLRGLRHWGRRLVGRGEPWQQPTPAHVPRGSKPQRGTSAQVEPKHEDVAA